MLCCETCDTWCHFRCVGLERTDAGSMMTYMCPRCCAQNGQPYPFAKEIAVDKEIEDWKIELLG